MRVFFVLVLILLVARVFLSIGTEQFQWFYLISIPVFIVLLLSTSKSESNRENDASSTGDAKNEDEYASMKEAYKKHTGVDWEDR